MILLRKLKLEVYAVLTEEATDISNNTAAIDFYKILWFWKNYHRYLLTVNTSDLLSLSKNTAPGAQSIFKS